MREHLVDRPTANPRLASYLLFWCPFFQNTAADVPPLPDIAIHESHPPLSGPPKRDYYASRNFRASAMMAGALR
jgi:hypothetical protein